MEAIFWPEMDKTGREAEMCELEAGREGGEEIDAEAALCFPGFPCCCCCGINEASTALQYWRINEPCLGLWLWEGELERNYLGKPPLPTVYTLFESIQQLQPSHLTRGDRHAVPLLPLHVSQSEIRVSQRWRKRTEGKRKVTQTQDDMSRSKGHGSLDRCSYQQLMNHHMTVLDCSLTHWMLSPSVENSFPPNGDHGNKSGYFKITTQVVVNRISWMKQL